MFSHTLAHQEALEQLGLRSKGERAVYEPSAGLIIGNAATDQLGPAYRHELSHWSGLSATVAGLTALSAMAYRNTWIELRLKLLNERFGSGVWAPILGWMDDIYGGGGGEEFYDDQRPYYHVSLLKRAIGTADSLLYALGTFETANSSDRKYWHDRFPWSDVFSADDIAGSFMRGHPGLGLGSCTLRSLLEASALYCELLSVTGDSRAANSQIRDGVIGRTEFMYYGPFVDCHVPGLSEKPYQLLAPCAFWALNPPLPHFAHRSEMGVRHAPKGAKWTDMTPPVLFGLLLDEALRRRLHTATVRTTGDLAELAAALEPFMESRFGDGFFSRITSEDDRYIQEAKALKISTSFDVALGSLLTFRSSRERLEAYFVSPPLSDSDEAPLTLVNSKGAAPSQKLDALVISLVGHFLIPQQVGPSVMRFRSARPLLCPAVRSPLSSLCPESARCTGTFPGVRGMLPDCWFQEVLRRRLALPVARIGILTSQCQSVLQRVDHDWWPISEDAVEGGESL